jgi:hypothetical protein
MKLNWESPELKPPPFNTWILIDTGRPAWDVVVVSRLSPNGNKHEAFEDFIGGGRKFYSDHQFYLHPSVNQSTWDFERDSSSGDSFDFYSDDILNWAHVPQ